MDIIFQIFLGIALASVAGLRAFVPLLVLGALHRLLPEHVSLHEEFGWLSTTPSLIVLSVAALAELAGDKVPAVDHVLDAIQTPVRTLAGILVFSAAVSSIDSPILAVVCGIALGGGASAGTHTAKAALRGLSTVTTAGLANPFLSVIEDILSFFASLLSILLPIVGALLGLVVLVLLIRWGRILYRRLRGAGPA